MFEIFLIQFPIATQKRQRHESLTQPPPRKAREPRTDARTASRWNDSPKGNEMIRWSFVQKLHESSLFVGNLYSYYSYYTFL